MKKNKYNFKICTVTLTALLIVVLLQRFAYSGFVPAKNGMISKYNFELWKAYWTWLPGKSLCIVNAVLLLALIMGSCWFVFRKKDK